MFDHSGYPIRHMSRTEAKAVTFRFGSQGQHSSSKAGAVQEYVVSASCEFLGSMD